MKKSVLYSLAEGAVLVLTPLLFSAVLSASYMVLGEASTPVFGILVWLAWLTSFVFAVHRKSAGSALCLAVLLFFSCVFYALSFAAEYEILTLSAGVHALFTLFGFPYKVTALGMRFFLPEAGTAALFSCIAYLVPVAAVSGYASVRFGKKNRKK